MGLLKEVFCQTFFHSHQKPLSLCYQKLFVILRKKSQSLHQKQPFKYSSFLSVLPDGIILAAATPFWIEDLQSENSVERNNCAPKDLA